MNEIQNPPRARRWAKSRQIAEAVSDNNYTKIWTGSHIMGEVKGGAYD